jgi:hypothetical protein
MLLEVHLMKCPHGVRNVVGSEPENTIRRQNTVWAQGLAERMEFQDQRRISPPLGRVGPSS